MARATMDVTFQCPSAKICVVKHMWYFLLKNAFYTGVLFPISFYAFFFSLSISMIDIDLFVALCKGILKQKRCYLSQSALWCIIALAVDGGWEKDSFLTEFIGRCQT